MNPSHPFRPLLHVLLVLVPGRALAAPAPTLEEVQAAIEASGARWVAGETSVTALSPEERAALFSDAGPLMAPRSSVPFKPELPPVGLPTHFDWRDNGGNFMSPIRQQAGCGSCWAFSSLGVVEALYNIAAGDPDLDLDLSEQILVSCGGGSCTAWYVELALDFLASQGTQEEACLPYTAEVGSCEDACDAWSTDPYLVSSWSYVSPDTGSLKEALLSGPVIVAMDAYPDFSYYKGGIYTPVDTGDDPFGHAVVLVGWDDAEGVWIGRNSWGVFWGEDSYEATGEKGWFRIPYGVSGIQSWPGILVEGVVRPDCSCADGDEDGAWSTDCDDWGCAPRTDCDDDQGATSASASEVCDGQDNDCDGEVDNLPLASIPFGGAEEYVGERGLLFGNYYRADASLWLHSFAMGMGYPTSPGDVTFVVLEATSSSGPYDLVTSVTTSLPVQGGIVRSPDLDLHLEEGRTYLLGTLVTDLLVGYYATYEPWFASDAGLTPLGLGLADGDPLVLPLTDAPSPYGLMWQELEVAPWPDTDGDGTTDYCGDCDDQDPSVYRGAEESCNGLDDNCDMTPGADEVDEDGDGIMACEGDCDDGDPTRSPLAAESCNGEDDDCDGSPDSTELDPDGDGWMACAGDCDDDDLTRYPGAGELCNGVDDDCDGTLEATEQDQDGDGWRGCEGDCDDSLPTVHPGALEVCSGVDDDCDGAPGSGESDFDGDGYKICDGDCDDEDPALHPDAVERCNGLDDDCDGSADATEVDRDGDGWMACAGDCDDEDPTLYPGAEEVCDGLDGDCDGVLPEDESDADADGVAACEGDCDDGDASVSPVALEVCDTVDNDCDGVVDGLAGSWAWDVEFGDTTSAVSKANAFYGNAYQVTRSATLDSFEAWLDPAEGTSATFSVFKSSTATGTYSLVWSSTTTLSGEARFVGSGDIGLMLDSGSYYVVGVGTTGTSTWYRALAPAMGESGPFLPQGYLYDTSTGAPRYLSIDPNSTYLHYQRLSAHYTDPADEDGDGDGWSAFCGDCDDEDAATSPSATEACNGVDDDCDGYVPRDERDGDGDGWSSCEGDCDDTIGGFHPGAVETWYDGLDEDCDGSSDFDADGDGHPSDTWGGTDCDDARGDVHPGAADAWYDGLDSDCDGQDDFDADRDGWPRGEDCDDGDGSRHPGAPDTWYDGVDTDCDGASDDDADGDGSPHGEDCDDGDGSRHPGAPDTWYDGLDTDCDGASDFDADLDGSPVPEDCDDADESVHLLADEVCNGVDDDCDGTVDGPSAAEATDWYLDGDGDGYGAGEPTRACSRPEGHAATAGDCDDARPDVSPAGTEACGGVDEDCDGSEDEAGAAGETLWYADSDGDGFGAPGTGTLSCGSAGGTVAEATDCDDGDPLAWPGAPGWSLECERLEDPGDTGEATDTGAEDTGPTDTGESADTEETADTGDTPDPLETADTGEIAETGESGEVMDTGETGGVMDTGETGEVMDTAETQDSGDTKDTGETGDTAVDTAETQDSGDTGDTAESGDTADTAETRDTGDTGDTAEAGDTAETGETEDTSGETDTGEPGEEKCGCSAARPSTAAPSLLSLAALALARRRRRDRR